MGEQVHQLSLKATKTYGVRLTPENSCWRSRKNLRVEKLTKAKSQPRWNDEEDQLLADLYLRLGANCVEEFQKIFPSRSARAIHNRRWRLDLVPGGAIEIQFQKESVSPKSVINAGN